MLRDNLKELVSYALIILVILFIRTFIVTPVRVNGDSMYSTLEDGEIMILNKVVYRFSDIERFDIVVAKTDTGKIIKRVIGLPGETLKYENNTLYIDGQEVKEVYLNEKTEDFDINEINYTKIPSNCYFLMGDNRDNSKDSRMIGPVCKKDIVGRARIVLFPFENKGYRD